MKEFFSNDGSGLIKAEAVIDAKLNERTPLHLAALAGHADVVRELIKAGAKVDAKTNYGDTPLHCAAFEGHVDVIRALTELAGARVDDKTSRGETPLHFAAQNGRVDAIKALIIAGAGYFRDEKTITGDTPLHYAALNGHVDAFIELLRAGFDVNSKAQDGSTPLSLAKRHLPAAAFRAIENVIRELDEEVREPSAALSAAGASPAVTTAAISKKK